MNFLNLLKEIWKKSVDMLPQHDVLILAESEQDHISFFQIYSYDNITDFFSGITSDIIS
jgi:hypothetical protein